MIIKSSEPRTGDPLVKWMVRARVLRNSIRVRSHSCVLIGFNSMPLAPLRPNDFLKAVVGSMRRWMRKVLYVFNWLLCQFWNHQSCDRSWMLLCNASRLICALSSFGWINRSWLYSNASYWLIRWWKSRFYSLIRISSLLKRSRSSFTSLIWWPLILLVFICRA